MNVARDSGQVLPDAGPLAVRGSEKPGGIAGLADGSLTRKEVVRALRAVGQSHGLGTVGKTLADLTAAGKLVNPRDKRGYRMPIPGLAVEN